ncbi:sugar phosphate isomerase/epimerase family protein [Methanotorris igneus]|uniref:Xylose isomerase domain-containing protein TIM barrel n=1 Tax=Methanotorris igneus (strain DSM 5666 / JCM 11834 / Kol 5) TaxID=880724 RepID=F6BBA9_METIK|nr:sugar phosphate isomerase/epimerase [Methanotorris igneus]AEF97116.1 Xylose isomerase domain-containing protein TIM barrel [Methanotorris igneus Kol 5]
MSIISCTTLFFWEYPIEEIADIFKSVGLKSMEFFPENPEFWDKRFDEDYLKEIKSILSKFYLTIHAPYIELNPSSTNPYIQEATIKETLWAIDLANFLGAEVLTIHPGKRPTKRPPTMEEYEKFYHYLDVCIPYAEEKSVTLSLENMPKLVNYICHSVEEIKQIIERYRIGLTLDFAHAKENAERFVEELHEYIKNTHISGVCDGREHYPLYHSQIDFSPYIKKLVDYGYKGSLVIEINDLNYNKELSKEEKISELLKEIEYLEKLI